MVLTYRYKIVDERPIAGETRTPLIPLTLKGDFAIDTTGIPDSGADYTAIPLSLAEAIGIDLSGKSEECIGIGGRVKSKESELLIELGNAHERYRFTIPVKVILDTYEFPILLGREGFLINFSSRLMNYMKK
jgi:predicted aspartyl protease